MRKPQQVVFANGVSYRVLERSGYLKAVINGQMGWTSVWADTYTDLVRRIKQAQRGGQ